MNVLIACEFSGTVRESFCKRGHNAWSCDLLDTTVPGKHIKRDIREALKLYDWDLMIAHPPCTYISSSGLHWNGRTPGRAKKTREAIEFVEMLWECGIPRIAVENPVGCLPTHSSLMKASQIIQPYDFGHDASKQTCLWLKDLPLLIPPPRSLCAPANRQRQRALGEPDGQRTKQSRAQRRPLGRAQHHVSGNS